MSLRIDAARVVADLRQLRELTSDERGAQRLAWTEGWSRARSYYRGLLNEIGLSPEQDEAGNLWTYIPHEAPRYVAIGSHLDSVPNGGWLDGALGVMTGVGIARAIGERTPDQAGLALVDFADEEGARFGRSLFGSSAVSGSLDSGGLTSLIDGDGQPLPEVLARAGIDLAESCTAEQRLENLDCYLELHIEQGPVLEANGLELGIVEGAMGIARFEVEISGQPGHAGSTPMHMRRDPVSAFANAFADLEHAARTKDGLVTTGVLHTEPGISTIIPGRVRFTLDLRHADASMLAELTAAARESVESVCRERGCQSSWSQIWQVAPTQFDRYLVDGAAGAAGNHGSSMRLYSGAGHDAVEMARRLPAAMMFAPSRNGLSHVAEEDTEIPHLLKAISAFAEWVGGVLDDAGRS